MAMIRIDPNEMTATASLLRSLAVEVAQICSEIPTCCCCAMPPETESLVKQIVARLDVALDNVARDLGVEATNLSQRGGLAANDSLTTASAAATGTGLYSSSMTIGGGGTALDFGAGVLGGGGTAPSPMTIGGGTALGFDAGVLGGGGSAPSPMTIGGDKALGFGTRFIGGIWGSAASREAGEKEQARIISGSPPIQGMGKAWEIGNFAGYGSIHNSQTPSRSSVENSPGGGHPITLADYENRYPQVKPPKPFPVTG